MYAEWSGAIHMTGHTFGGPDIEFDCIFRCGRVTYVSWREHSTRVVLLVGNKDALCWEFALAL